MYEDKTLICKDCKQEFVFTAGEQEFYAEKGFVNEPQRCKACRAARKAASKAPRECTTQHVQDAARHAKFRLFRKTADRFIAVNALLKYRQKNK